MTWPSALAPASAPADHGVVRTQAYYAAGGNYFRSGHYHHGIYSIGALSGSGATLNRLIARPILIPVRRSFDRIGCNVSTAATASSGGVVRMGLYTDNLGVPGTLVSGSEGTVSSESTGAKEITVSLDLAPGLYWVAIAVQVSGCSLTFYPSNHQSPYVTSSTSPPIVVSSCLFGTASGALPSSGSAITSNTAQAPAVCLRAT